MRHDHPLEAVLVLHRRTGGARAAVLAAGFEPMAECDTLADGLVLSALYRPDLLVVDAAIARSPTDLAELRLVAHGAEVVLVAAEAEPAVLADELARCRRRLVARGHVPSRGATRGLPVSG
jgi:hypothetical protein